VLVEQESGGADHVKYTFAIQSCAPLLRSYAFCGDYAAEHEITFDSNKTIGVLFCPKKYKQPAPSNVFLNSVCAQFLDQVKANFWTILCCTLASRNSRITRISLFKYGPLVAKTAYTTS